MLNDLVKAIGNKKHYDHSRLEHRHDRYRDDRYGHYNPLLDLVHKLLRNKVVLVGIVVVVLIVGAVGIWLIAALLPYIGQAVTLLDERGIKGILDMAESLLRRIWEGAGK